MTTFDEAEGPASAALGAVPPHTAAWTELEAFCQTIAGREGDPREVAELADIAARTEAKMRVAGVDDLLTSAYFHWRKYRWNEGLDHEAERALRSVIAELGRRAHGRPSEA